MRFSIVAAVSVVAPLVAAHGRIPGAPKVFGLPRDLMADAPVVARTPRHAAEPKGGLLETRQGGQNGRCGPSFGGASCAAGFCCSGAGVSWTLLLMASTAADMKIVLRSISRSLRGS